MSASLRQAIIHEIPVWRIKKIGIWRTKLMRSKSIIKGVSIGISTAILWSIVLNSKVVGIGVGICLGISLAISDSPISSKKDKDT